MAVAALTAGGRKAGNKTPPELLQRFSFEPVMLMICGVNKSPEMTCWNFFVVLMRSMRTVRNFCILQALCNIKPKLVRNPEGEWEMLIHAYLSFLKIHLLSSPINFTICFDPKFGSF